MNKKILLIFLFNYIFIQLVFPNQKEDTLDTKNKTINNDRIIELYKDSCWVNRHNNPKKALEYGLYALYLTQKLDLNEKTPSIYNYLGVVRRNIYDNQKAIDYFKKAYELSLQYENKLEEAYSLNNLGDIKCRESDYSNALDYLFRANKIFEKINDQKGMAYCHYRLSLAFYNLKNYNKSLSHQFKALEIRKKRNDYDGVVASYNSIAENYQKQGKKEESLNYYQKGLEIYKEKNDKSGIAHSYKEIGEYYYELQDYNKSIEYLEKAIKIATEINAYIRIRNAAKVISEVYKELKNYDQAYNYYVLFKENDEKLLQKETIDKLAKLELRYEFDTKLKIQELEQQKRDLANKEKIKRHKILRNFLILVFLLMLLLVLVIYRSNKEHKKINKLLQTKNVEIEQQKEEIQTQAENLEERNKELEKLSIVARETDNAVVIIKPNFEIEWINEAYTKFYGYTLSEFTEKFGTSLIKVSTNPRIKEDLQECKEFKKTVNYISINKTKNKDDIWVQTTLTPIIGADNNIVNYVAVDTDITKVKLAEEEIQAQRDKIETQFKQIAEININITSSIKYAGRIQQAIFPVKSLLNSIFPQNLILNMPRDIVSGDFYWFAYKNDKIVVAVADCTGHGVPGGFMSILGISSLNEIINKIEKIDASDILNRLRQKVIRSLHQTGEEGEAADGMDIALCVIDTNKKILQFAGAINPLYLFRNNELIEFHGDKMPIGVYKINDVPFKNYDFKLEKNDTLYLFTDGYADQFGGKFGKKYLIKSFRKLLKDISHLSFKEQKQKLIETHNDWRRNHEQLDDILILGIKI
ncbi:MAG: tetratricopeptide repeat protein [Bacteroidales bacterium]|nr:tetratricopeptide repeat protein [Bacteroidales bacterium]